MTVKKAVQPDGCIPFWEKMTGSVFYFYNQNSFHISAYEKEEVSKFSLDAPDVPVHGPQQFTGVMKLFSFLRG